MKLTAITKNHLRVRRAERDLKADGFEEVDERGGKLWELHCGRRLSHVITDVRIGPWGTTVWIKTADIGTRNRSSTVVGQ